MPATTKADRDHVLCRPFRSTERHPLITMSRTVMVTRAQEIQMAAGQLALLLHADPENGHEIHRWSKVIDDACRDLGIRIHRDRTLRDVEGIA